MNPIRQAQARFGTAPVLLVFTVLATLLALAASQVLVSVLALGDRLTAAWAAGVCASVLAFGLGHLILGQLAFQRQTDLDFSRHASLDALTGVFNRRHFLNQVEREWSLARRYNTDCALLVIDIDHFKRVNDGFGHRCGDLLLRQIADACSETLRQADVLARFGGEEFILFLPHTDPLGALDVAERVRERIERLNFAWNGHSIPVSASVGVAALQPKHQALEHLVHEAEDALDLAKTEGRNCVRAGAGLLSGKASSLMRN
ncbi:GGDEF domain-containing protein [Paucibacter sp. Y2R2-4]|uniref:GGDEF domain-containing protein n=1 Tax=Paucibacter sp. Y2R2-4 TaxID=2893553 RepID=UPI0021E40BB7|nr:GGDEF domain-containing protein [Paucibacter sp. Y2R2-4]MCV2348247.1 GGDEF domain-containing protein [Paucibacter sp. Y2R2-4]